MEILNQAMEFTQQYSLFFLAGMFQAQLIQIFPCDPLVQSFFACMFLHPTQETGQYQTVLHMHTAHIFLFHWIFDCFCRCRRI